MSRRASHGASREASVVVPETAVPDGETAATTYPYCDRPFRQERLYDLHAGDVYEDLSDGETAAYEIAVETEAENLFIYHLKVASVLGVAFTMLLLLAVVGLSL